MDATCQANQATISLRPGESFFFKPSLLKGVAEYDWTLPPPFPWGSPFVRLYHRCWMMKRVDALQETRTVAVLGSHPRGSFQIIELSEGQRYFVSARCLAGFSGRIRSIHTRIKAAPIYWLLHEHFFSIFEGPGTVLLYGPCSFQSGAQTDFHPSRIVAFDATKAFRPVAPSHRTVRSQCINLLFSHEIIWQFAEPGGIVAEAYHPLEGERPQGFWSSIWKHLLGFFRI